MPTKLLKVLHFFYVLTLLISEILIVLLHQVCIFLPLLHQLFQYFALIQVPVPYDLTCLLLMAVEPETTVLIVWLLHHEGLLVRVSTDSQLDVVSIVLGCLRTVPSLHFLVHEIEQVHVACESAVASRDEEHVQLRVGPTFETGLWSLGQIVALVHRLREALDDGLHERYLNFVVLLMNPCTVSTQKYAVIDTHIYLLELVRLAHQCLSEWVTVRLIK